MKKILIIDDSRMILEVAKNMIKSNIEDVEVMVVSDPLEGVEILSKETFHLLVLDIVMPSASGMEVLRIINTIPALKTMKTIMFSSLNDSKALSECFRLGAYDYIGKPLDVDEFLARINHALSEYELTSTLHETIEKLEVNNKELENLNVQLKEAQGQLIQRERLAGIGNLAAGLAHEVNNPLGFIKSNVSTLRSVSEGILDIYDVMKNMIIDGFDDDGASIGIVKDREESVDLNGIIEDIDDIFDDVDNGIERIAVIIDALQKFSNIQSIEESEAINVNEAVDIVIRLLGGYLNSDIKVVTDLQATQEIYGNASDVNMALYHVVKNAIEAIGEIDITEGVVTISTRDRMEDQKVDLMIRDSGIGMDSEVIHHSIDPFFTTKSGGAFVGMGLTTAYNCFVKDMNGQLDISSDETGTLITITLPV